MNRELIEHATDPDYRVVSRPHDLWVAQRKTSAAPSKTVDPWQDEHAGTTRADAIRIMCERAINQGGQL